MNIYIDADACPTAIKEIIIRAAERARLTATFVANTPLVLPDSPYIFMLIVKEGPDIADDTIVELVTPGDLVISEDVPLADRVIEKGALAITTRGHLFTKDNIKSKLATRDLLTDLRNSGIETGGPAPLNQKAVRLFANQLDTLITRNR